MKLVSVIIPTYNREYCIKASIESVLRQNYNNLEVIIVDDGSEDKTKQVVESIQDNRVHYYFCSENKGAGVARNYGVSLAKGEYIAFHDSDDIWLPDKLEKQMNMLEKNPTLGLVYGCYLKHKSDNVKWIIPDTSNMENLQGFIFPNLLIENSIGAPTVLLRKKVFLEVGGFDEQMRCLEDWDFAIKVAKEYEIGFIPEVLIEVSTTQGGLSSNWANYFQNRIYLFRKYIEYYQGYGLLEEALMDIFGKAEKMGILPQVKKMVELYLK